MLTHLSSYYLHLFFLFKLVTTLCLIYMIKMEVNGHDDPILPVLIVGAGPVGLTLAFLLNKLGLKCAILERDKEFSKHPKAHFANNRSMEVLRKMDGLAADMLKLQCPVDQWKNFVYCTSLTGRIISSVDQMRNNEDFDENDSPTTVSHLSQHKFVRLLLDKLNDNGFDIKHSERDKDENDEEIVRSKEILMGYKCISVNPTDRGVTVTVSFEKEGSVMEKDIQCKYLVAADGARSTIREMLGIKCQGLKIMQPLISVHFFSRELAKCLVDRPGMIYKILNCKATCLIAHSLEEGEFVIQMPYFPPQQTHDDFRSKKGQRYISEFIGRELDDIQIVGVKPWFLHSEIADKFLSSDNRVILIGDAAHRFPPTGGFGMNMGIQDAHNLAWKLAYVMKGIAPQSFLSTYEMERRQIANFIAALSVENLKEFLAIHTALGIGPETLASVYGAINSTMASILPSALKKAVLFGILSIINVMLSDFFLNEKNPFGSARLAKVRQIFEDRMTIRLLFPAEDLGLKYLKGALASDGSDTDKSDEFQLPIGSRRKYVPSTEPGSRLPHMNIRVLSNSPSKATIISTLDLTSIEKAVFVLIIAPIEESYKLAQAAFVVAEGMKISLMVCVMWPENTTDSSGRSQGAMEPWKNIIDVAEIKSSPSSPSWWELCKMENSGAILVRPDDHVAWRSKTGNVKDKKLKVKQVFETIFGLNAGST